MDVARFYKSRKSASGYALGSKSGFTLIELLVVVAIIGLLSSVTLVAGVGAVYFDWISVGVYAIAVALTLLFQPAWNYFWYRSGFREYPL